MSANKKYDLAISFAGEDRAYAESINFILTANGISTFYDTDFRDEIWGSNLIEKLHSVYYEESRYCLMLLSNSYKEKMWTNLERQSALSRHIRENMDYILPVVLDDSRPEDFKGMNPDIGYFKLEDLSEYQIVTAVKGKLGLSGSPLIGAEYCIAAIKIANILYHSNIDEDLDSTQCKVYASLRPHHCYLHSLRGIFLEMGEKVYEHIATFDIWKGGFDLLTECKLVHVAHHGFDGYTVELMKQGIELIHTNSMQRYIFEWYYQRYGFPHERKNIIEYLKSLDLKKDDEKTESKSGKGECLAPPPHTTGHAGPHPAVRKAPSN